MPAKLAALSTNKKPKRVLVAPLDWGLGHATRCVPIIHGLLRQGALVWLAGEGPVQALLQAEFPDLPFLPLEGYRINYGRSGMATQLQLLQQLPRIFTSIRSEHRWLRAAMQLHQFDAVIADNRYGLYHPKAVSVFITHQLQIQSPLKIFNPLLLRVHYRLFRHFDACWVPDAPGTSGLSAALAHPGRMPLLPTVYVGPLSRLQHLKTQETGPVLILLSGPEPQRTLLEQKILAQANEVQQPLVLVRGLPGHAPVPQTSPNLTVYNHLAVDAMEKIMNKARLVIGRSGYSTIMDLAALHKKSVLVPTPGQTEQQYLARHLQQQGFAPWLSQHDFQVQEAIQMAQLFSYRPFPHAPDLLTPVLHRLLQQQPG